MGVRALAHHCRGVEIYQTESPSEMHDIATTQYDSNPSTIVTSHAPDSADCGVKTLHIPCVPKKTGEMDKSVILSCDISLRFNVPKLIEIGLFLTECQT